MTYDNVMFVLLFVVCCTLLYVAVCCCMLLYVVVCCRLVVVWLLLFVHELFESTPLPIYEYLSTKAASIHIVTQKQKSAKTNVS